MIPCRKFFKKEVDQKIIVGGAFFLLFADAFKIQKKCGSGLKPAAGSWLLSEIEPD